MKSFHWLIYLFLVLHQFAAAQSIPWFGLNGGDMGAARALNPAFLHDSRFESSLGIGSVKMDYNNNLGYFIHKSFIELPFHLSEISVPEIQFRKLGFNPAVGIDRDLHGFEMKLNETDLSRMYFSTSLKIEGPSYFKRLKEEVTVGVSTGFLFAGGLKDYPSHLTYGPYRRYTSGDRMSVPVFSGNADGVMYFGINVSKEYTLNDGTRVGLGGNFRYLGGLMHFDLVNEDVVRDYYFIERDKVEASNMQLSYRYSHSNLDDLKAPWIKGNGMGGDLGIYFDRKVKSQQFSLIRGGISVVGLGFVKYNSSMRSGVFRINEPTEIYFGKFDTLTGFDQLVDSFEYVILKKTANEHSKTKGGMIYTPASLNMTFSVGLREYGKLHFFASTPLSGKNPEAFQVGLIPELTFKTISVLTPFSYNRWTGFRLGAGLNIGFLTLGTDDVRTFFKRDRLQSGSFFCSVSVNYYTKTKKGKKK